MKAELLKPQENRLAVPDLELISALEKNYRFESSRGETIQERGDLKQKNLWMSQVSACPREVNYSFFQPHKARDYTIKGLLFFADGKLHHKDAQRRLEEQKKLRLSEGYLEDPETGATGKYDGLVPVEQKDGWLWCDILEFKTKFPGVSEVIQADYDQDQYYIFTSKFSPYLKKKRIKIRGGRLLYKDRSLMNEVTYLEWKIESDKKRQIEIRDFFYWLKVVVIEQRILVEHPFTRDSVKCQYCRYHDWCWRGFPKLKATVLVADKTVKAPEKELVESAINNYMKLTTQIKGLKEELDKNDKLLASYFKAKGIQRLSANDKKDLKYSASIKTSIVSKYLYRVLDYKTFFKIASPQIGLLNKAVKDGLITGATVEKAKKTEFGNWGIKIVNKEKEKKEKKEVKNK